jgi:hypothetical protein
LMRLKNTRRGKELVWVLGAAMFPNLQQEKKKLLWDVLTKFSDCVCCHL